MSQPHIKLQVLRAVADRLAPLVDEGVAGIKAVRVSRVWPTDIRDLPAVSVYAPDGIPRPRRGQPGRRIVRRTDRIQIVAVFPRPADPDNTLEEQVCAFQARVEELLGVDPTLRSPTTGRALTLDLQNTADGSGLDPASGLTLVLAWLSYSAAAAHREGDPTHPITEA